MSNPNINFHTGISPYTSNENKRLNETSNDNNQSRLFHAALEANNNPDNLTSCTKTEDNESGECTQQNNYSSKKRGRECIEDFDLIDNQRPTQKAKIEERNNIQLSKFKDLDGEDMSLDKFLNKFTKFPLNIQNELIVYYTSKVNTENNTVAMIYLAHIYVNIENFQDIKKALDLYNKAACNNNVKGLFFVGYLHNKNSKKELKQFIDYYNEIIACGVFFTDQGASQAMYELGSSYLLYKNDSRHSLFWYLQAFQAGNRSAVSSIIKLYDKLMKLDSNIKHEAFSWATQVVENGFIEAKTFLSNLHRELGDKEKSIHLAKEAANEGIPQAMHQLSYFYDENGETEQCIFWLEKATSKGNINAMYNLGLTYLDLKNLEQSIFWFKKAAYFQDVSAIMELGTLYINKLGKLEKGIKYFEIAAQHGNDNAISYLKVFTNLKNFDNPIKQKLFDAVNIVRSFGLEFVYKLILGFEFYNPIAAMLIPLDIVKGDWQLESDHEFPIDHFYAYDFSINDDIRTNLCQVLEISDTDNYTIRMSEFENDISSIPEVIQTKVNMMLNIYCAKELDLSNIEFKGMRFIGNEDEYINFINAKLYKTNLEQATLKYVNISGISLTNVIFNNTIFKSVILDLDQLEYIDSLEFGKVNLKKFTVTNKSIYKRLFTKYQLMVCDDKHSNYTNMLLNDIKALQLKLILECITDDIYNKGGTIENINDINSLLNSKMWFK